MKLERETRMKFDDEIDAALQSLREVQPPAAMMSRVQQSLETAAAKSQQPGLGRFFWIPLTSAVVAGVLLLALSLGNGTMGKRCHGVETAKVSAATPEATSIAAAQPAQVSTATFRERKPIAQRVVVRRVRRERPRYRHVANLFSYPLTREEKLLVRFVETAKPADLQALNPAYQAKIEAQQDAEFEAYLKSGDVSNTQETTEVAEKN